MDNYKEKAIQISNAHQFSEFLSSAKAINGKNDVDNNVPCCTNHLDTEFMDLLKNGAHLDINIMPI